MLSHDFQLSNNLVDERNIHIALLFTILYRLPKEAVGEQALIWKLKTLYHLLDSPKRFGELRKLLLSVTQQMLTTQLRELEQDKVIHREIYKEIPPKVEYSITEFGKSLTPVLKALTEWGIANISIIEQLRDNTLSNSQVDRKLDTDR